MVDVEYLGFSPYDLKSVYEKTTDWLKEIGGKIKRKKSSEKFIRAVHGSISYGPEEKSKCSPVMKKRIEVTLSEGKNGTNVHLKAHLVVVSANPIRLKLKWWKYLFRDLFTKLNATSSEEGLKTDQPSAKPSPPSKNTQMNRLIGMIRTEGKINLPTAEEFLNISQKQIKLPLYEIVGDGKVVGQFEGDNFVFTSELDDFLLALDKSFKEWGSGTGKQE